MTALGINISTQDRTYTWADVKPARHNPPELASARTRLIEAEERYQELTDIEPLPHALLDKAREEMRHAQREYSLAWDKWCING